MIFVEKGDIVKLEYEIWIKEGDEKKLYATNREEVAKENGIYEEDEKYGPEPFIIGIGRLLDPVDEALLKANVGEELEIEIPPEKGFGQRNPNLIERIPLREFRKKKITPVPGERVAIGGRVGTIITVAAGRVIIDFNHPLAGKTLIYKVKVVEKIEDPKEKIKAVIEGAYGKEVEKFEIEVEGEKARIVVPDICKYDPKWENSKLRVASDVLNYCGVKELEIVEKYRKEEKKEGSEEEGKEETEERKEESETNKEKPSE